MLNQIIDPLYNITCDCSLYPEIKEYLFKIGGVTNQHYFAYDYVVFKAQLSNDTNKISKYKNSINLEHETIYYSYF